MRRRICLLLALVMVLALLPASAGAANVLGSGTCGSSATWVITDDGVMTIKGKGEVFSIYKEGFDEWIKYVKTIVVEEGITRISFNAFSNSGRYEYKEEALYLPDSLERIEGNAFSGHLELKEIHFGTGLKTIGTHAFEGCVKLESLALPDSVESLSDYAFASCDGLQELVVPGSIGSLAVNVFANCTGLKSVVLGEGITKIGMQAFYNCTSLSEIQFPTTLTSIQNGAFQKCTSLEFVSLPALQGIESSLFEDCSNLKEVYLEEGTQVIGDYAFRNCEKLENVYIPDSVTQIGTGAFMNCFALTFIRLPADLGQIDYRTFFNCSKLEEIIMPSSIAFILKNAFYGCSSLKAIYYAGTEEQLGDLLVEEEGNDVLFDVDIYLIPAMPDPVFYLYDMPARDNWAYPGIAFCLYNGLMNGVGNGYFQPNGYTTRAQLVTILWRMMGEPKPESPAPFTDLTQDWYRDAVAWAAENNITNGTSATTFAPDEYVTREQMVTIFYRMCRDYLGFDMSPSASLDKFPDNGKVSDWAVDAMQWGIAVKLINGAADGSGNVYLMPQGNAIRSQVATVMLNFVTAFEEYFVDEDTADASPQAPAALPTEGLVSRKGI